jgi:hypothetical protein
VLSSYNLGYEFLHSISHVLRRFTCCPLDTFLCHFHIRPAAGRAESIAILNEREEFLRDMQPNINAHFIKHPSNSNLAKYIVYTKHKTPEQTCSEILELISQAEEKTS